MARSFKHLLSTHYPQTEPGCSANRVFSLTEDARKRALVLGIGGWSTKGFTKRSGTGSLGLGSRLGLALMSLPFSAAYFSKKYDL